MATRIPAATVVANGTGTVTVSGVANDVNTVLASLTYTPSSDYQGLDTLHVTANLDRRRCGAERADGRSDRCADRYAQSTTRHFRLPGLNGKQTTRCRTRRSP